MYLTGKKFSKMKKEFIDKKKTRKNLQTKKIKKLKRRKRKKKAGDR